ncbi:MBL fold metallo-hydrolase [Saccharibacillus sp. CPCC 101409]|uniref:MBL fold metallo-hydrolase n=1 Tax=Saccharibacillus sp. CPCC 101409 TaxID=3058041 RepID=UPI00267107E1|nr:MBL fold metallo-hydrolase [Saccharibacillus sp. CPCC 101409]MDO3411297.1 MBL fold metallo-hydrolase [Saccharibacillus sp. CPCC 101409]
MQPYSNSGSPDASRPEDRLPGDVTYLRTMIVNVVMIGAPGSGEWVLVDTGMPGSSSKIVKAARERFGTDKPKAILLTHGHFDHTGSVKDLMELFPDVPVYAHELELPFLTGRADYPPGDPTVGGGLMAASAPLFPNKGIDLGGRAQPLPADGSVPYLPDWHWLHTPGHSEGHVSFFRNLDGTLVAGDAFITVKQESALAVLTQRREIHGPPTYFTPNWEAARTSVARLVALRPAAAVTGHGEPMAGDELVQGLEHLSSHFDEVAVPASGRYVDSARIKPEP